MGNDWLNTAGIHEYSVETLLHLHIKSFLRSQCHNWFLSTSIVFIVHPVLQEVVDKTKDTRVCGSCSLTFPCRMVKKIKSATAKAHFLCEHCIKVSQ